MVSSFLPYADHHSGGQRGPRSDKKLAGAAAGTGQAAARQ